MRAVVLAVALLPLIGDCGKKKSSGDAPAAAATTVAPELAQPAPTPVEAKPADLRGEQPILIKDEKAKKLGDDEDHDVN